MLDKMNKTIIDSDELAELVAERDKLAAMCAEAIKSGEKLADERDKLLRLKQAVEWVLDDGSYKAPEEWNWLCKRWYERLSAAWGEGP